MKRLLLVLLIPVFCGCGTFGLVSPVGDALRVDDRSFRWGSNVCASIDKLSREAIDTYNALESDPEATVMERVQAYQAFLDLRTEYYAGECHK